MKTRIVQIGNSPAIRIPKLILEQTGLDGEVHIRAEHGSLVIESMRQARQGWAAAFQEMSRRRHDGLLDPTAAIESKRKAVQ
jgi:antitoxin component of MazEF toxin-antitoxin module